MDNRSPVRRNRRSGRGRSRPRGKPFPRTDHCSGPLRRAAATIGNTPRRGTRKAPPVAPAGPREKTTVGQTRTPNMNGMLLIDS
ncbi:hypothetical protein GCM10010406_28630 [Streptomyces thermolineatus]|uniref:Uncharacterized protein n=1 Tax=Streptomyces thermolineatus TaxID=44033 RepID=A0ABP5Z1J3_9ACTN